MIGSSVTSNPRGPETSYDPNEPYSPKKVMRGGSFLCNDSYCSGFRNSMRMKSTPDSSSLHAGFRTVVDVKS
jgi:formylglycine-generating enzyme required for sulfatase activity